jgi:hypothetical protein
MNSITGWPKMAETDDINALYREFTDALTDVFAAMQRK